MKSRRRRGLVVLALVAGALGLVASRGRGEARVPVWAGSVAGRVAVQVPEPGSPPRLGPYSRRRAVPPARVDRGGGGPRDVVLFLRPHGPLPRPRGGTISIVQRDRTILPYLTVVPVGTRIEFPNEDEVFHNLFSLSEPARFDLGRYPPGQSRHQVFGRPGLVRLLCDIHSEMAASIFVVDTPWFARPDAEGRYRIDDVPPGRYTMVAWHELAGTDSLVIDVPEAGLADVDFELGAR